MQLVETRRQKECAVQDPLFQAELKTAAEHLNAQSNRDFIGLIFLVHYTLVAFGRDHSGRAILLAKRCLHRLP